MTSKYSSLFLIPIAACSGDDTTTPPCDATVAGNICTIAGNGRTATTATTARPSPRGCRCRRTRCTPPTARCTSSTGTTTACAPSIRPPGSCARSPAVARSAARLDNPANGDFNHPTGMVFDASGANIVIAAWHNSKVRVIALADGSITDMGGDGRRGYFGDETPGADRLARSAGEPRVVARRRSRRHGSGEPGDPPDRCGRRRPSRRRALRDRRRRAARRRAVRGRRRADRVRRAVGQDDVRQRGHVLRAVHAELRRRRRPRDRDAHRATVRAIGGSRRSHRVRHRRRSVLRRHDEPC